jgi:hypothetical protein
MPARLGRCRRGAAQQYFHPREEIDGLLDELDVIEPEEQEEERQTVADGLQHWHAYAILARRSV